jgi:hypothetical protein
VFFFIALENVITSSKPLIRFCHQSYIEYVANVLCIVNEIMNNNSWNVILKGLEINRKLNELFEKELFCYVTKYTYVAQKSESTKIAIQFLQYNILICDDKISTKTRLYS